MGQQTITPSTALRLSLEKHNETFETLLKLIPPKYYLIEDPEAQVTHPPFSFGLPEAVTNTGQQASKYQKHSKKQKTSKQAVKEASKKAKRDKVHLLRMLYPRAYSHPYVAGPNKQETVLDIQKDAQNLTRKRKVPPSESDEEIDIDDPLDLHSSPSDHDDANSHHGDPEEEEEFVPMPASGGIADLRTKLHTRMAQLRRGSGGAVSGGGKDELLEERRRQRAAMRERRRKETRGED